MTKIVFKIYVAGLNPRNRDLISKFHDACAATLGVEQYKIEVVDISRNMQEAESQKILATPTIIRTRPYPEKRIIGDFRLNNNSEEAINFLIDDLTNRKKNGQS